MSRHLSSRSTLLALLALLGSAALGGSAAAQVPAPAAPVPAPAASDPQPLLIEDSGIPYNTALGFSALGGFGNVNSALGAFALHANVYGEQNTAAGYAALQNSTFGIANTGIGVAALVGTTTGIYNTAVGMRAGAQATGNDNTYLGAFVEGVAGESNTLRLGRPYSAGAGQNRTFLAGVWGTTLTGTAAQVFVDANGQLGTGTPVAMLSGTATLVTPAALQEQAAAQEAINAELRARITHLEARIEALLAARRR